VAFWLHETSEGIFTIVERSTRGVDLYFGKQIVGQFRSPREAAEQTGDGGHLPLPCAPDNGLSLGVPMAVSEWKFFAD
jgi:hypothetical protein